jgi:putative ABC transport system permease protein
MSLFRRLLNVFRQKQLDEEFEEELRFHREMSERHSREKGLTAHAAEAEAKRRLGNLTSAKGEMRDARTAQWLSSCIQDLRHGCALLRRDWVLCTLIVTVLALGIGGNAAIFSLFKAAFLDPLPYREADRLVTILALTKSGSNFNPTVGEFVEIRKRTQLIEQISFVQLQDFQITGADEPARILGTRVTASFLPLLGVNMALGRTFEPGENTEGRNHVVILSDDFWRSRMGSDPNILGQTLRLNDEVVTVIGVLPRGFSFDYPTLGFPEPPQIYTPFPMRDSYPIQSAMHGRGTPVRVLGRLRDKIRFEQAAAELKSIGSALAAEYPQEYQSPNVVPSDFAFQTLLLREAVVRAQRPMLQLLLAAVAVLLMIACANTAQLLLARSLRRQKEISIRSALGAGRLRLIRQLFLEGLLLATLGGTAGFVVSHWMTKLLVSLLPIRSPLLETAKPDVQVMVFTIMLSALSAVAFAIIPAIKGSQWTMRSTLNSNTIGDGSVWGHVITTIEAALSVFLLCGTTLIALNLWTMISAPEGFNPHDVLIMQVPTATQRQQSIRPIASVAYREYLYKIAAIPEVDAATVATGIPLRPRSGGNVHLVDDPAGSDPQIAWFQSVSADYFRTFQIPLLQGRTFRDDDIVGRPHVAIVNEEFLRQHRIATDPIGRQIEDPDGPITIIGIVGNTRTRVTPPSPEPQVYTSYLQFFSGVPYIAVRSVSNKGQLLNRTKEAIRSSYSDQTVFNVSTMDDVLSRSAAEPRFNTLLIATFALVALSMAAIGMYSVISCLLSQRTREIALRLALGARPRDVLKSVFGRTGIWVFAGLMAGIGLAAAATNTIRYLSNTIVASSPVIYAIAFGIFLGVTLLATWLPFRRAVRIDAVIALRGE